MLEGRSFNYDKKTRTLTIEGEPPEEWDNLSTIRQFEEFYKLMGRKELIFAAKFNS